MVFYSPNNTKKSGIRQAELHDVRKNGKEFDWNGHKIDNAYYAYILDYLTFKKATRVSECAENLEFLVNKDNTLTLQKVWFCKSKLCPMCNWRRSLKLSYQNMEILNDAMRYHPKARFLFLTLTVKNVHGGGELKDAMTALTKGFNRLFKYKKVDDNLLGWLRTTEVTVNEKDGSYHPHIHVLLMVKSTYFKDKNNYITQSEWTTLWKKAMKLDYTPIVDIRAVKGKSKTKDATTAAVLETSKYPVKSADYITHDLDRDADVIGDLEHGLYKKRQLAYGKLFKTIRSALQLDDVEDGDLVKVGDENIDDIEDDAITVMAYFDYNRRKYYTF